jgi:DNA primase large subunit
MDSLFNARYPFSKSARRYAESLSVKLDYETVEKGRKRVADAVLNKRIPTLAGGSFDIDDEIAAYAVARMIVSQIGGRQAVESYAVAEAKRASSHMKSDSDENVQNLAKDFGLGPGLETPVLKYLAYAPREAHYRLVNTRLNRGKILLSKNEFIRVLEEAVRLQISGSLPLKMSSVPPAIRKAADGIRELMPKPEVNIALGEKPPCIVKLLENLAKGENLPHSARLALTVYLLKAGMPENDIVKLFATSPDYDERVTRYQVDYIRRKGYSMPACRLMDSNGLCVYRCGVRSPLAYRGKRFNKYEEKK